MQDNDDLRALSSSDVYVCSKQLTVFEGLEENEVLFFFSCKHTSRLCVISVQKQVGPRVDLYFILFLFEGMTSGVIHNFMASSICFCHGLYFFFCFVEGRLQLQI